MSIKTITTAAALAISTAFATSAAFATPINHLTSHEGNPYHLYQQFGALGYTGLDTPAEIDANRLALNTSFSFQLGSTLRATMLFEWAGKADFTTFGIYDQTNSSNRLQLWGGAAGPGINVSMSRLADGSVILDNIDTGTDFATNQFGYYILIDGITYFFSNPALNPGGIDQMAAFNINATDYLIAFEDLLNSGIDSDKDFNDLAVKIALEVPEPGTLAVLGMGLFGLGYMRRRQTAKA